MFKFNNIIIFQKECKHPKRFEQMKCNYYQVLFILSVIITLNIVNGQNKGDYKIPQPTAAVLSPRGFRISIPDERGIVLFDFHGNINKKIQLYEPGDLHAQTKSKSDGIWSYENRQYQLQRGDVLNFWVYVQHGDLGYSLQNQRYRYPEHFVFNTYYGGSSGSSDDDTLNYNSGNVSHWEHAIPARVSTPTRSSTRSTSTKTTSRTSSINFWPGTTQRPLQTYQQYPHYPHSQQNPQSQYNPQNPPNPQHLHNQQDCHPSITTVNKEQINCRDSLIFEEQFNYGLLDRWIQDIRMPLDFEDAEFVLYHNYRSVWNVSNGNLNIFPKLLYQVPESGFSETDIRSGHYLINPAECTSFIDPNQECERKAILKRILPPVVSAKFRSKQIFNFKYGRVEIRAKLPKGDWIFPQVHLEPTDNIYRGTGDLAYLNGQVRIGFIHGNEILENNYIPLDGKILIGVCVISAGDTVREVARKSIHFGQDHFGNDFHTYSIIWTNSTIRFLVDGLEYGTDTGGYKQLKSIPNAMYWETGTNMAPFDQEFHIALGVGVGGNADFPDGSRTGLSKTLKPWENTSPKAELNFFMNTDEWHSTWNNRESGLIVDYVKVYSV